MIENDWFRGIAWDKETQHFFENKLKRLRDPYNKAQYIRIKASYLLASGESLIEAEGIRLMERLIKEFPNETSHVMFAYEQLGDYYFAQKNYREAELNYRQSISFYKLHGRSGSSGIGDIKLAEAVFNTGRTDAFPEVYYLLTDKFKKTGGKLLLNDDMFRYYSVLAKITNVIGEKGEAKEYAEKALQLAENTEPQLDNFPKLGIVKTSHGEIDNLKNILNQSI